MMYNCKTRDVISEMCFQVVSSCGSVEVYTFTLKVGSFSLLLTHCRVLVMAVMLVVNGFVNLLVTIA